MERQPMNIWATPQSCRRMDECFVWLRAEGMRLPADLPQAGREQGDGLGSGEATALIKISLHLKAGDKARTSKPKKQAS